jgi:hypothetical protein
MAGFTVDEGLSYIGNVIYKAATQETYTMGLFVNAPGALTTSSVWANVTQPTGTGYSEITLVAGSFTVSAAGVVTYPLQAWTATDNWSADVQGYYIRNNNGTPKLVHVEYRPAGGFAMTPGKTYEVDLSVDTS